MYNIQDGRIIFENVKRMNLTREEVEKYSLLESDLLVNRVNSRELVGKTAIVEGLPETTVFESKNIRVRLKKGRLLPHFVNVLLQERSLREAVSSSAKQTVGMATISQPQIAKLTVPVPSLDEQREIVTRIAALLKGAEAVKSRVTDVLRTCDILEQSILSKAFRGELVPTEAELARREGRDYEPASVLLESIRVDREATEEAKPKKKARRVKQ